VDEACSKAMTLQLAGRLDQAEQLYRAILLAAPHHAAANYCVGMLNVQLRRPSDGLSFLLVALQANPQIPDYWLGYLEALLLSGRSGEAGDALILGRQHGLAGDAADDFAKRLVQVSAADGERTLLAALEHGDRPSAHALARHMTELHPARGVGWKVLGALLWAEGCTTEALAAMQTSALLLPQDSEAHCNLGLTLSKLSRFEEAETCLRKALDIDPTFSIAHYRLGMTYSLQARLPEAEASLRRGLALRANYAEGDDAQNYSNLLFILSHDPAVDADSLFAEHCRFGADFENPLRASWPRHANDRDPDRCLKVGFVSGDLYEHSVGQFLEPIVAQLKQRPGVELHAYCANSQSDALSRRLHAHFKSWNPVGELSDIPLAAKIMEDRIDVLIDLSGHTGHNRLPVFARKPAPVQVSWLGYPGTTGLKAIDYYLADRHWLPAGQFDRLFTEKLAYLPDRWAFKPHAGAPAVGPLPALATGRLTFGSFHRLGKINSATIQLWSQLLLAVPQATMLVLGVPVDGPDKNLLAQFAAHGVDPGRLTIHGRSTMDVYLAFHNQVDIGLDTLTYAGATTTMHSLSMGVPTLTVAGATSQARAGAGILGQLGLDRFIAANTADFIEKARYWAEHLAELADLRAGLRARLLQSPGGQPELIASHFEAALRHMWRRWCAGLDAESFLTDTLVGMNR
jgi:predicted O-linked N-acetylglucosamine transferase (SPINDLY family)